MAEAPPPYAQRKKSSTTTIVFVVLGICAVCCVLGVGGFALVGWYGYQKTKPMIACAIGFGEAAESMRAYTDDHGGKLPDAEKWQDELRPYFAKQLKKDQDQGAKMFGSFDPDGAWTCKDVSGSGADTGIAFNSDLGGEKLSDVKNKSTTIVLFEVPKTGTNLTMPYVELNRTESPKIFGKPRGWFHINADMEVGGTDNKNERITFGD